MSEAKTLARILLGMCEGGGEEEGVDIYADDYSPGDGDVFVSRAAELLVTQQGEIEMLTATINLLSAQLAAPIAEPVLIAALEKIANTKWYGSDGAVEAACEMKVLAQDALDATSQGDENE